MGRCGRVLPVSSSLIALLSCEKLHCSGFASSLATGSGKKSSACQCMGRREAEVWQCRSKLARGLIVRRCLTHFAAGFKAWAYVLFTSLACLFGLWSLPPIMHRWATAFLAQLLAQGTYGPVAVTVWALHDAAYVDNFHGRLLSQPKAKSQPSPRSDILS